MRKCVICFRARPVALQPLMGDLPAERIIPSRPFTNTGVNYCGPINVRPTRRRGIRPERAYIAICVCFCTKAIHIELVGNLSTELFLGALKICIGRSGKPLNIYSDNAINFVRANNELKRLKELFYSESHLNTIVNYLVRDNITWHFIPLRAPEFGGLWEAAVKAVKYH